jgi:outer membrane protein assembly factor BamB
VRSGQVIKLDVRSGAVFWTQTVSGSVPLLAGLAVSDKRVYATSADGILYVLDSADGKTLQRLPLFDDGKPGDRNLSISSPVLAGHLLYVGSETGGLRAYAGKAAP